MMIKKYKVYAVLAGLVLLTGPKSWSQTIGTWSLNRSNFGFADHESFEEARASINQAFPGSSYLRLETLTNTDLGDVDLLILPSRAVGEGGSVPLSSDEKTALLNFVSSGGTFLAHVPSQFDAVANSYLSPFNLETTGPVLNGSVFTHSVAPLNDPILDGPFGDVQIFQNRFESHISGINNTSVEDNGGIALADTGLGPVLVLFPRGTVGDGQAIFFTNFFAFHDSDFSSSRGLFGGSNDNEVFLLNILANSIREVDTDGDGTLDGEDNCPEAANPDQSDTDGDGIGDVCDSDIDGDGIENSIDNCPSIANVEQEDYDNDGEGDSCDDDIDGDGFINSDDSFPRSDIRATIKINGKDLGIPNTVLTDGATMMDLLNVIVAFSETHGDLQSGIAELTNEWKANGLISGKQKGLIQKATAKIR